MFYNNLTTDIILYRRILHRYVESLMYADSTLTQNTLINVINIIIFYFMFSADCFEAF